MEGAFCQTTVKRMVQSISSTPLLAAACGMHQVMRATRHVPADRHWYTNQYSWTAGASKGGEARVRGQMRLAVQAWSHKHFTPASLVWLASHFALLSLVCSSFPPYARATHTHTGVVLSYQENEVTFLIHCTSELAFVLVSTQVCYPRLASILF